MALLGLERSNLFVFDGAWDAGQIGSGSYTPQPSEAYLPAFIRRHPFAFLRTSDDRHVLAIDAASHCFARRARRENPSLWTAIQARLPIPRSPSARHFRLQADNTIEFVKALEARELLVERQANLVLKNGRNLGLTGFRIVDETRFVKLDGPTLVEWHAKGWLAPIHFHLASLDRFDSLARRQALRDESANSAAGPASLGPEPSISQTFPVT